MGHEGTVTSVSASDHLIVTGGLDKKIMSFDIRALSQTNTQLRPMNTMILDESAVLKVCVCACVCVCLCACACDFAYGVCVRMQKGTHAPWP